MPHASLLLVDDDVTSSQILSYILVDEGYQVESAETGGIAIEKFSSQKYDVVLLDYFLPDISGLEVAKSMRAINPSVKIILLSGYANADEPNGERFEKILLKPVPPDLIVKTIAEMLN